MEPILIQSIAKGLDFSDLILIESYKQHKTHPSIYLTQRALSKLMARKKHNQP
jgi:molybdopterin-guanine dinucleotide biosynthesis protein